MYLLGYEVSSDSLIAICRLREGVLTDLQIPDCCISTSDSFYLSRETALERMQYEVSCALEKSWRPLTLHELPLAVRNVNVDADGAYLDELLQDQIW